MTYKDIEVFLTGRDESKLEQLLSKYTSVFEEISNIALDFSNGVIKNKVDIEKTLTTLTGHYMTLKDPTELTDTWKEHYQNEFYNKLKEEAETNDEKFVDGTAKQLSSASVQIYRRVRNIFNASLDRTDKGISTCQSLLKNIERERAIANS